MHVLPKTLKKSFTALVIPSYPNDHFIPSYPNNHSTIPKAPHVAAHTHLCVRVPVCEYSHAHTHAGTHARTHAHTHTQTNERARTHACTHVHRYLLLMLLAFFGTIIFALEYDPTCLGASTQDLARHRCRKFAARLQTAYSETKLHRVAPTWVVSMNKRAMQRHTWYTLVAVVCLLACHIRPRPPFASS